MENLDEKRRISEIRGIRGMIEAAGTSGPPFLLECETSKSKKRKQKTAKNDDRQQNKKDSARQKKEQGKTEHP